MVTVRVLVRFCSTQLFPSAGRPIVRACGTLVTPTVLARSFGFNTRDKKPLVSFVKIRVDGDTGLELTRETIRRTAPAKHRHSRYNRSIRVVG